VCVLGEVAHAASSFLSPYIIMLSSLTKLEAINTMLATIGESPVNSLTGSLPADTTIALNLLTEVSRDTQAKGWHFNTEFDVEFTPDAADNKITVSGSILRLDLESHNAGDIDIVMRGTSLYDRKEHTYEFTDEIKATVVYGLAFEDLPHVAKQYVTIRAARILSDRMVGSVTHHQFTSMDERYAWNSLIEYEGWTANHSIFDNMDTYNAIRRGSPIDRVS